MVKLHDCDLADGRCFAYCPRTAVDLDSLHQKIFQKPYQDIEMGPSLQIVMARATEEVFQREGQNGGVVSTLMNFAIGIGMIDSAILTQRNVHQLPEGRLARNREEILACAGSSYVAGPTLEVLNKKDAGNRERIGVVGTPCQVLALAKMRTSNLPKRTAIDQVELIVGLFCTWALRYDSFVQFLMARVDSSRIMKLDITPPPERLLKVTTDSEILEIPLDEIRSFIRPACRVCLDMTSELSDISVGTVEGLEGWSTVVVRTRQGEKLLEQAEKTKVIDVQPLPEAKLKHLKDASLLKKRRALESLRGGGELENGYLLLSTDLIAEILSETDKAVI